MTAAWAFAVGAAAGIAAILVVARWLWWLVLPRIREQITGQMNQLNEVHTAVTKNGHTNPAVPTLRDDLADIKDALGLIKADVTDVKRVQRVAVQRLDSLESWAESSDNNHESRLAKLEELRFGIPDDN